MIGVWMFNVWTNKMEACKHSQSVEASSYKGRGSKKQTHTHKRMDEGPFRNKRQPVCITTFAIHKFSCASKLVPSKKKKKRAWTQTIKKDFAVYITSHNNTRYYVVVVRAP
ncbi:hypothetical protein CEXT_634211 [Caerostris extrusa]|uniref:Uncharacterized protein n=1 Tax=Caerostris extrusa TaxID=172846 RepID=A0AAV4RHE4_CAEEX|nr:hypothetical protein CEXT_634211 [Caerostris extrusa]